MHPLHQFFLVPELVFKILILRLMSRLLSCLNCFFSNAVSQLKHGTIVYSHKNVLFACVSAKKCNLQSTAPELD